MNVVMAMSVVAFGAVLLQARGQVTGDRGQEKQNQGPSTASRLSRDSARDDKSNTTADSSPQTARNDNANRFAAKRLRRRYVQTYKASADRVFAVMEPVEEVKWAPGFEFEWVYAQDGPNAKGGKEGDVFSTRHGEHEAVWVISKRDFKERAIQFVRFLPGVETVQIDIHVTPNGTGSRAEITYTWTALSEHGRERLKAVTQEVFERDMKEWQEQVEGYLARSAK